MNTTMLPTARQSTTHIKNLLIQKLSQATALVTYDELNRTINADVRKDYRHTLNSARKIVLADYGMLFKTIAKVGLKPLTEEEKLVQIGASCRKGIHSKTKQWRTQHDSIDTSQLTDQNAILNYSKECLRLALQEDVNTGSDLKIEAAVETAVQQKDMSPGTLKQLLYAANEELKKLG